MTEQAATLSYVPIQTGCAGPILTTMSQNIPNNTENLTFNLLKKRDTHALSASLSPNVDLVGKQLKRAENSTYVLGFYNPGKNTIRFVPTTATINVKSVVKNQNNGSENSKFDTDASGLERKAIIVGEIGTKKSQKILRQLKNKIFSESKIQSANDIKQIIKLQSGVYKDEMETQNLEEFQKEWNHKKSFLPDFNLSAKSANKIYNIKSIISENDYAELYISELFKTDIILPYITTLAQTMGLTAPQEGEIEYHEENTMKKQEDAKKKQLLYLNYLIKMKKMKKVSKDLMEVSQSLKMPLNIIQSILDNFYQKLKTRDGSVGCGGGVKYTKSKALDIKMTCYILILNLIICGFKVNLKDLMSVLKIEEPKAVLIATEVGCTIQRSRDNIFAKLKKLKLSTNKSRN